MTTTTMTTMNSASTAAVQNKTKTPLAGWMWSGREEPQSYYNHEDEDTMTLTVGEQRRIQLNHANAQRKWRNSDEGNDRCVVAQAKAIVRSIQRESAAERTAPPRVSSIFWTTPWLIASGDEPVFEPEHNDEHEESTHVPFINLTKKQRADKSEQFQFGLCSDCDAGLDDKSDFVCEPCRPTGAFVMRCNACHDYYQQMWLKRVGCECGGCN